MTTPYLTPPVFSWPAAPGGKLHTYAAGGTVAQATYSDAAGATPNANPVTLDTLGSAVVRLAVGVAYHFVLKDSLDVATIWDADNFDNAYLTSGTVTAAIVGAVLYPQTAAELAAGVTPTNYIIAPGIVDRYGTNTTPGTTDMSTALQSAVNQMLKTGGAPVRFGSNAYSIVTPPTFGGASTLMMPIDIGGNGPQSQIIHNGVASTGALFDLSTRNGWYLHDFWMMGNSAHKNDGIYIGNAAATESIRWRLERVNLFMAGYGVKMQNTNTGTMKDCKFWPNNPPVFIVPQTVNVADVLTHIYLTGAGFNHNISFIDVDALPDSLWGPGAANVNRGIKMDCNSSYGVNIIGGVYESNSGANNEIGIEIAPTGACGSLTIVGTFIEGSAISLKNVSNSYIGPVTNGTVGSTLTLLTAVRNNLFAGIQVATINNTDPSNFGNTWVGCYASTTWTQNEDQANFSNQPNRYIGCSAAAAQIADRGGNWRKILTYAPSMALDAYGANEYVVRVNNGTAFAFTTPTHPYNGQRITVTLRNENAVLALGAVTWNGVQGGAPGVVPLPAATMNREYVLRYDSDFGAWYMRSWSPADIPN